MSNFLPACVLLFTGYTWAVSAPNTDPVVMTIPPGKKVDVILSGNKASTATKSSNDDGPCGVVALDPFQSSGYSQESPFLRPGTMPISAYCQETPIDDTKGFMQHIVRFNETTPEGLKNGHIAKPPPGALPATEATPLSPPPAPEAKYGDNGFWRYNPNQRMFFQTFLRHMAIVDFTCQCRMGVVPALLTFSGVFNTNKVYSSSELGSADQYTLKYVNKIRVAGFNNYNFYGPNIWNLHSFRPDHFRMACPVLWVAKWACLAIYKLYQMPAGTSGYCSGFQTWYDQLKKDGISFTQCNSLTYEQLMGTDGVPTQTMKHFQLATFNMFMCYSEEHFAGLNAIIDNTLTGTLTYKSDDCHATDVTIKLWETPPLTDKTPAPTNPPPPPPTDCSPALGQPCTRGPNVWGNCCGGWPGFAGIHCQIPSWEVFDITYCCLQPGMRCEAECGCTTCSCHKCCSGFCTFNLCV